MITVPCPHADKSGTVCGEPFTVEVVGGEWTGYTPPSCRHQVRPAYLTEQARIHATEGGDPQPPAGPQGSESVAGAPAPADGVCPHCGGAL